MPAARISDFRRSASSSLSWGPSASKTLSRISEPAICALARAVTRDVWALERMLTNA
jgi:hypothetical protein